MLFSPALRLVSISLSMVLFGSDLNAKSVGLQNLQPLPHPLVISTIPLDAVTIGGIS